MTAKWFLHDNDGVRKWHVRVMAGQDMALCGALGADPSASDGDLMEPPGRRCLECWALVHGVPALPEASQQMTPRTHSFVCTLAEPKWCAECGAPAWARAHAGASEPAALTPPTPQLPRLIVSIVKTRGSVELTPRGSVIMPEADAFSAYAIVIGALSHNAVHHGAAGTLAKLTVGGGEQQTELTAQLKAMAYGELRPGSLWTVAVPHATLDAEIARCFPADGRAGIEWTDTRTWLQLDVSACRVDPYGPLVAVPVGLLRELRGQVAVDEHSRAALVKAADYARQRALDRVTAHD